MCDLTSWIVIQAFLNSLSSGESSQGANGGSFTPDQVERLSNKLGQILGDIEDNSGRRNEKGEVRLVVSYSSFTHSR